MISRDCTWFCLKSVHCRKRMTVDCRMLEGPLRRSDSDRHEEEGVRAPLEFFCAPRLARSPARPLARSLPSVTSLRPATLPAMKILGQDVAVLKNQVVALQQNVLSWLFSFLPINPRTLARRVPRKNEDVCVRIDGPGGMDRLAYVLLSDCSSVSSHRVATVGYNLRDKGLPPPFVPLSQHPEELDRTLPDDAVLVKVHYFSVNYADVTIRWGLYESALRYVGWPIVPGFDFSGVVDWAGKESGFAVGDQVFGFTLFGAYSSLLLVPAAQLRVIPTVAPRPLSMEQAAALPAVAATALHAIAQAGAWPEKLATKNKAALVHSAAGGVGGMLVQMLKERGFYPIVGVVGSSHKVQFCRDLGADYVIDKSKTGGGDGLWREARQVCPDGFVAVFDASGVETLAGSYENLCRCGRLVTYGFHSNLPKASALLSPAEWVRMAWRVAVMPRFDPMALVLDSKVRACVGGRPTPATSLTLFLMLRAGCVGLQPFVLRRRNRAGQGLLHADRGVGGRRQDIRPRLHGRRHEGHCACPRAHPVRQHRGEDRHARQLQRGLHVRM